MSPPSDLAKRIKRYEEASSPTLIPNTPVLIRVDGRAFHTFTRHCDRPFDHGIMDAMVHATVETSKEMSGFKLAYTQSDEATFVLTNSDTHDTEPWFGNKLSKLISLSAALFTVHFNRAYLKGGGLAAFDARAFVVPLEDAPNVFVWRQQDWWRNSLQMLAHAHFDDDRLKGKKNAEIHDMLMLEHGVNWARDLTEAERNGTFVHADRSTSSQRMDFHEILAHIRPLPSVEEDEDEVFLIEALRRMDADNGRRHTLESVAAELGIEMNE